MHSVSFFYLAAVDFYEFAAVGFVLIRFEIYDLDRLVDVKRAKFAVRAAAVVVVHPIRHVAVLLNFADDATSADCVHRARLYEVALARFDRDKIQ